MVKKSYQPLVLGGVVVLLVFVLCIKSCTIISPNERGVKVALGQVVGDVILNIDKVSFVIDYETMYVWQMFQGFISIYNSEVPYESNLFRRFFPACHSTWRLYSYFVSLA